MTDFPLSDRSTHANSSRFPERKGTALVLVAHGSSHHPKALGAIRRMARSVAEIGNFDESRAVFVKGRPRLAHAFEGLNAAEITVVPILTSSGYFFKTVLPRELRLKGTLSESEGRNIRLTHPVGEHPQFTDLLVAIVERVFENHRLDPRDTAVAVVGHGTRRNRSSGSTTHRHAETIRDRLAIPDVLAVFLDQDPEIEEIPSLTSKPNIVVVPNLVGGAGHELDDLPHRTGVLPRENLVERSPHEAGGRLWYFAPAPGNDPGILAIILDLARPESGTALQQENIERSENTIESIAFSRGSCTP